jgi:hypothetical protein
MNTKPFVIPVLLGAVAACGIMDSTRDVSPLSFAIREGYIVDPPPPPLQIGLLVSTETQYPCLGYWLENELSVAGSVLHVSVSDRVRKPQEVCAAAIGPAGFRVELPVTVGSYTLEFARNGVTDRYTVTITDTAIEIATIEAHFTTPTALSFPRGS